MNPEEQVNLQEPEVATPVAAAPEVKKGTSVFLKTLYEHVAQRNYIAKY